MYPNAQHHDSNIQSSSNLLTYPNVESPLPLLSISRKRNFSTRISPVEDGHTETDNDQFGPPTEKRPTTINALIQTAAANIKEDLRAISVSPPTSILSSSFSVGHTHLCQAHAYLQPAEGLILNNDEIIYNYTIVGTGNPTRAIHRPTGVVFVAKAYNFTSGLHIRKIIQRLDNAEEYYHSLDVDELTNCVLPKESELVQQKSERFVLFIPAEKESVHTYASERGDRITEREVIDIFKQLVRIVHFCHTIGLLLRDIKPKKFFFFQDKGKKLLRLETIQDLIVLDNPAHDSIKERFGSPAYVPPEVLVLDRFTGSYSGKAADVWGMGVFLYMLLCGKYPFYDTTPAGVFRKIRRAVVYFPANFIDKTNKDLVLSLLRKEPKERLSAAQLLDDKHYSVSDIRCRSRTIMRIGEVMSLIASVQNLRRNTLMNPSTANHVKFHATLNQKLENHQRDLDHYVNMFREERVEIDEARRAKIHNGPMPQYVRLLVEDRMTTILRLIRDEGPKCMNFVRKYRENGAIGQSSTAPPRYQNFLPYELLLPPEIYPPRPDYNPINDPVDYRCYVLLCQNDCLEFPQYDKGDKVIRFERPIYFTGEMIPWKL